MKWDINLGLALGCGKRRKALAKSCRFGAIHGVNDIQYKHGISYEVHPIPVLCLYVVLGLGMPEFPVYAGIICQQSFMISMLNHVSVVEH